MSQQIETYEEACQAIMHWGIVPLSSFIPDHLSLESITRPDAWHTGLLNDPWLWRDRLPAEGVAAYGRFIAGKPLLIAREILPLVICLLRPAESVEERYQAGQLARSTLRVYELVSEQAGIDARVLRKQAGMQDKAEKTAFDRALVDLQGSADMLISGISERLNEHGNKSGWNSTCYMLADHWMEQYELAPCSLPRAQAETQLFAQLEPHWSADAIRYLRGKLK
ncbi:MAG TPA: hypothetical protein VGD98_00420 [Ktedonobacteraceae bacterium]